MLVKFTALVSSRKIFITFSNKLRLVKEFLFFVVERAFIFNLFYRTLNSPAFRGTLSYVRQLKARRSKNLDSTLRICRNMLRLMPTPALTSVWCGQSKLP